MLDILNIALPDITEEEIDIGLIEQFFSELPDKAFRLGIRVLLAVVVFFVGAKLIKIVRKMIKKSLLRAMNDLGTDKTNTVMLGDQLLTDAWAGNAAGLKVIIVPPIKDKLNLFFRFKRWLEKGTVKRFKRKHGITW